MMWDHRQPILMRIINANGLPNDQLVVDASALIMSVFVIIPTSLPAFWSEKSPLSSSGEGNEGFEGIGWRLELLPLFSFQQRSPTFCGPEQRYRIIRYI
jgi:hypothetical protein